MSMESQWSHLPSDILKTIATFLNKDADVDTSTLSVPAIHNLRLRSVCKSWRSSIPLPVRPPNVTFLPFPIGPNRALNPLRRGHFTLSLSPIYLLRQPPMQQSSSSMTNPKYWLLRVENGDSLNKWHPLNPLSRVLTSNQGVPKGFPRSIDLRNFRISHIATSYALHFVDRSTTHAQVEFMELKSFRPKKVVLSTSGPLVALAISGFKLYSLRIGDDKWKPVDSSNYDDVAFNKGKFYAVDIKGRTVSVDGSDLKASEIVPRLQFFGHGGNFKNLVSSRGELFLIDKYCDSEEEAWYDEDIGAYMSEIDPDETAHLKIYKLNEEKREWERVNSLDDCVFFVGDDCSYSVSACDFPGLKPNCVYFCDDSFCDLNEEEEKLGEFVCETGVYCLDDGKRGALASFPDHWSLFVPPSSWFKSKACKSKK